MELPGDGALLINKPAGISSFGVVERVQRALTERTGIKRRDLPKIGHGGTLDPFATGLLVVCVGRAVKLAQYFLDSTKVYEGVIRFGETTIPGDPTAEISERSDMLPSSLDQIREAARSFTLQPYLQIPPMHSAKKVDGKPLYELARQGIEIEREPRTCHLYSFEILDYSDRRSRFRVSCSAGTYIRVLAQDLARMLGTVGMLDTLVRAGSGRFSLSAACTLEQLADPAIENWDTLAAWVPFDRMLEAYPRAEATAEEARDLMNGRQGALFNILRRAESPQSAAGDVTAESKLVAIVHRGSLVGVARQQNGIWGLDRVFVR